MLVVGPDCVGPVGVLGVVPLPQTLNSINPDHIAGLALVFSGYWSACLSGDDPYWTASVPLVGLWRDRGEAIALVESTTWDILAPVSVPIG